MSIFCRHCESIFSNTTENKKVSCPYCESEIKFKTFEIISGGDLREMLEDYYGWGFSVAVQVEDYIIGWSLFEPPGKEFFQACKKEGVTGFLVAHESSGDLFARYYVTAERTQTGAVFCQFEV